LYYSGGLGGDFASWRWRRAQVLDRTGIAGQYTIALQFAPLLGGTPADENLPDIFTAVQQLGLRQAPIRASPVSGDRQHGDAVGKLNSAFFRRGHAYPYP